MKPIIECVPNFSEGIDADVIAQIAAGIERVQGVKLLNVDAGHDANFCGQPRSCC